MLERVSKFLTSLRLTVTLLALGIAVVFFGTLAQTSDGLYVAQERYFKSWFSTWSPHSGPSWLIVPLPGGYLLGTMLLVNLVAAHIKRFQWTKAKAGIQLTHIGIILLLLGQLLTDNLARESRMSFAEGERKSFSEDFQKFELVFRSDAADQAGHEDVVAFPDSSLKQGAELRHERLPFTVRVKEFMPNSDPSLRAPMMDKGEPQASNGIAQRFKFQSTPVTGRMESKNIPTAIIEVAETGGKSLGSWVASGWTGDESMTQVAAMGLARSMSGDSKGGMDGRTRELARQYLNRLLEPQQFTAGSRQYTLELRPTRYYEPFALRLLKTTHEVYQGTTKPKDFRSRVRIENPDGKGNREVEIFMNTPLRHGGLAFFQFQMGEEQLASTARGTSVLQVVKNPSWLTPYIGCTLVAAGLLVQFLYHLKKFTEKRAQ